MTQQVRRLKAWFKCLHDLTSQYLFSCEVATLRTFLLLWHKDEMKKLSGVMEEEAGKAVWCKSYDLVLPQLDKEARSSLTVHMHCTVFLNFFLVRRVYVQMPKHVWDSISWKYLHKYTLLLQPLCDTCTETVLGLKIQNSSSESCHSSRIHYILHKCGLSCFPVGLPKRKEAERKSSHLLCLSDPWHPLQLCSGSPNPANGNVTPFYLPFISEPSGSAWPTVWISHFFEKLWKRERSENRDDQAWHTQISCKIISSKLMSPSSQPFPQLLWRI